jgi:hypothetical protein
VDNLANKYLSINSLDPTQSVASIGRIDDIRMLRADIPCRIRYVVPFSKSGRPDLVPGTYVFSVYVKAHPLIPVTPNRFSATGVSIAVDGAVNGTFAYKAQVAVAHPTDPGANYWSQWTLVKGSFSVTSIPSSSPPNAPMLQLSISPTDVTSSIENEDVGSLLIAAPRLEFVP